MIRDYIETGMASASRVAELIRSGRASSLASYAGSSRVEPECLIETSLLDLPEITDLAQVLCANFSAWYMIGWSIATSTVGNVETTRILDKLATNRDPINSVADRIAGVVDSSMESMAILPAGLDLTSLEALRRREAAAMRVENGRDTTKTLTENNSLAVGRVLTVMVDNGKSQTPFNIQVRLATSTASAATLTQILTANSRDFSAKERYHDLRSGKLKFWQDIIACNDVIDQHRKALQDDESGTYARVIKRKRKNQLAGFLSGNPGVNNMSTMYVISKATAEKVEREVGGKLKYERTRKQIMDATGAIFLVVVDREWERVDVWVDSCAIPVSYALNQLKNEVKSSGPSVQDLMKTFQRSTSPF